MTVELHFAVGISGQVYRRGGSSSCRPIYARRALEAAGIVTVEHTVESMRVPVEIVRATIPVVD